MEFLDKYWIVLLCITLFISGIGCGILKIKPISKVEQVASVFYLGIVHQEKEAEAKNVLLHVKKTLDNLLVGNHQASIDDIFDLIEPDVGLEQRDFNWIKGLFVVAAESVELAEPIKRLTIAELEKLVEIVDLMLGKLGV